MHLAHMVGHASLLGATVDNGCEGGGSSRAKCRLKSVRTATEMAYLSRKFVLTIVLIDKGGICGEIWFRNGVPRM